MPQQATSTKPLTSSKNFMRQAGALSCIVLAAVITLLWPATAKVVQAGAPAPTCQTENYRRLEADFQRMVQLKAQNPHLFSDEELKVAALNYIAHAEACFHAIVPNRIKQHSQAYSGSVTIDEGGLSPYTGELGPLYNTGGLKWGNNSPYAPDGQNQPGPGTPGGVVTYSYIPNGVSHSNENPGLSANVDVRAGLGVNGCVQTKIATAFAAWSAAANIQFVEVADSGLPTNFPNATGDIRIGAHNFDGSSGTLAHAYFPPFTGDTFFSIAGDMHFDTAETWSCTTSGGIDIGLVALHEIGHSIGLDHEPSGGNLAVMNPFYNSALSTLQADDINGAASIYGPGAPILSANITPNPFPIMATTTDITYTITVFNSGGKNATNVVITNTIPASATFNGASNSGSETSPGSGVIVWPATTVNQGASIIRVFQVSVSAPITDGNRLINTLSVTSTEGAAIQNQQFIQFVNPKLVYLPLVIK